MSMTALERALEIVGGQTALATSLGTTQSQVSYWLNKARRGVPAEYVIPIETATDGQVSRHDLRPDLYPPVSRETPSPTEVA